MKKYLLRSENLMLGLVIVFIALCQTLNANTALDFHLHDVYFVIAKPYIFLPIFLYTLFVYACYFFLRKISTPVFKIIEIIQISGLLLPVLQMLFPNNHEGLAGMPRRYYDYSVWESFKTFAFMSKTITFFIIYFIVSQLLFFLYFLITITKHFFKKP